MATIRTYRLADSEDVDVNGIIKPYDETPVTLMLTTDVVNTGSIDTRNFDMYRQGIELSIDSQYYIGIYKIHSGEKNHKLKQTRFGIDKFTQYSEMRHFQELDYFDPKSFLEAQTDVTKLVDFMRSMTFPILSPDYDESENYTLDGVIEPITIRAVASFYTINAPYEPTCIRSDFSEGNEDSTRSSETFATIQPFDCWPGVVPYYDNVDVINGRPSPGYFLWVKSPLLPFDDLGYKKGIWLSSESESMSSEIQALSPTTDTYISYNCVTTTCGFEYDDSVGVGTDSVTFGGLQSNPGRNPYVGTNF